MYRVRLSKHSAPIALSSGIGAFIIVILGLLFTSETPSIEVVQNPSPSPTTTSRPLAIPDTTVYVVSEVVDGDTIKVQKDGKTETVRLIGIDTPETVDPRKPVQCFGKEASAKTKELLLNKEVTLESDPSQDAVDKYGRTLAYIYLQDGTNVNLLLVAEGYATEYTYDSNPYRYQKEFLEAQQTARSQEKGFWAANTCAGKR